VRQEKREGKYKSSAPFAVRCGTISPFPAQESAIQIHIELTMCFTLRTLGEKQQP
jgi:hypothetical protein